MDFGQLPDLAEAALALRPSSDDAYARLARVFGIETPNCYIGRDEDETRGTERASGELAEASLPTAATPERRRRRLWARYGSVALVVSAIIMGVGAAGVGVVALTHLSPLAVVAVVIAVAAVVPAATWALWTRSDTYNTKVRELPDPLDRDAPAAIPLPSRQEDIVARPPLFEVQEQAAIVALCLATNRKDGDIDIAALVSAVVEGRHLSELPRVRRRRLSPRVQLLCERGPAMQPFRDDVRQIEKLAGRIAGDSLLETLGFVGSPLTAILRGNCRENYVPMHLPPPDTRVLVISDLGVGVPQGHWPAAGPLEWLELHRLLQRSGATAVFLCPYRAERISPTLVRELAILDWGRATSVRTVVAMTEHLAR